MILQDMAVVGCRCHLKAGKPHVLSAGKGMVVHAAGGSDWLSGGVWVCAGAEGWTEICDQA